jgi:hypothetical protein
LQLAFMATIVATVLAIPSASSREAGHLIDYAVRVLDRRVGHAVVLAGHPHDPGLPDHLQMAAAHGVHAILGESRQNPAQLIWPALAVGYRYLRWRCADPVIDARCCARTTSTARRRALAEAHPGTPALKNAMLPVVAVIGLIRVLSASVVTEQASI